MKLEKMYDRLSNGTTYVEGYKVEGKELYLMKVWYHNMKFYEWAICIDCPVTVASSILNSDLEDGKVIFCKSFKDGKQKLAKML